MIAAPQGLRVKRNESDEYEEVIFLTYVINEDGVTFGYPITLLDLNEGGYILSEDEKKYGVDYEYKKD